MIKIELQLRKLSALHSYEVQVIIITTAIIIIMTVTINTISIVSKNSSDERLII